MSFLDDIFAKLEAAGEERLLTELYDPESNQGLVNWTIGGRGLLRSISQARRFLAGKGLKAGDRCALLAANSIEWVTMD